MPVSKGDNRCAFEAALVNEGGEEALMYLFRFAEELFAGLCSRVEEMFTYITNQKIRIIGVAPNGFEMESPLYHKVYKAELKNGKVWVIDVTRAQFGFSESLYRWKDLERSRTSTIREISKFGNTHNHTYQRVNFSPIKCIVGLVMEKKELLIALDGIISTLAQGRGGKLSSILAGSDDDSKKAQEEFVDEFEVHLQNISFQMYTRK